MSENERLHDRKPDHPNHAGGRSFRRAIQAIDSRWRAYRMERVQAHEAGHNPDASPYPEGEGTEIELFVAPKPTERPTYTMYPLGGGGHGLGGSSERDIPKP